MTYSGKLESGMELRYLAPETQAVLEVLDEVSDASQQTIMGQVLREVSARLYQLVEGQ